MNSTLIIILEQVAIHLPLMFGAYISYSLLKVADLSLETAYVVGALAASKIVIGFSSVLPNTILLLMAIGASLFGGATVGLVSSSLTVRGKFSHLLSSIVTAGLFHGFNQFVSPAFFSLRASVNPMLIYQLVPRHPELFALIVIASFLLVSLRFFLKTQLGFAYAVYGNNKNFFKQYRISSSFIFVTGVTTANALAGLSGYLFAQSNSFVELNMGAGKALLCITALILGKAALPNKRSLQIPLLGTTIYFTVQQLLLKVGFNLKYFTAVQSLIVLCLLFNYYRPEPHNSLGV